MFWSVSEAKCMHKHINKEKHYIRVRRVGCKPRVEISKYLVKAQTLSGKKIKTCLAKRLIGVHMSEYMWKYSYQRLVMWHKF